MWPDALVQHVNVLPVLYFVFTEVTSLPLNIRWLFENHPSINTSKLTYACWIISGVSLLILFFIVRVVPSPYFLAVIFLFPHVQYKNMSYYPIIQTFGTLWIPFALNLQWFRLLVRKAYRVLLAFLGK